ncbi:hypothetical protein CEUSTIGMA_g2424.t1 [Chlamydomonas eustigma]|uniref:Uncharacterized protein n=1 Tax=Chlamydomonas eustigma TaxID=1157962 RepID=A0A250WVX1_9CHLO|nr:hypothetical protein CEUSTIGMA_g2424.t1 [Chlamydomonas eustigma]|eukprot:GAX74978.1 hypothetical protein CEUSTIGMA_g2424.t1 [Chlamydomonas eustigma]
MLSSPVTSSAIGTCHQLRTEIERTADIIRHKRDNHSGAKSSEEEISNEQRALCLISSKIQNLETCLEQCKHLVLLSDVEKADVMTAMDTCRRDLLAATRECGPHVHIGKDVLKAVVNFASLRHVTEAITPRNFGVEWKGASGREQKQSSRIPEEDSLISQLASSQSTLQINTEATSTALLSQRAAALMSLQQANSKSSQKPITHQSRSDVTTTPLTQPSSANSQRAAAMKQLQAKQQSFVSSTAVPFGASGGKKEAHKAQIGRSTDKSATSDTSSQSQKKIPSERLSEPKDSSCLSDQALRTGHRALSQVSEQRIIPKQGEFSMKQEPEVLIQGGNVNLDSEHYANKETATVAVTMSVDSIPDKAAEGCLLNCHTSNEASASAIEKTPRKMPGASDKMFELVVPPQSPQMSGDSSLCNVDSMDMAGGSVCGGGATHAAADETLHEGGSAMCEQDDACSEYKQTSSLSHKLEFRRESLMSVSDTVASIKTANSTLDIERMNEGMSSHDKEVIRESVLQSQQDQAALLLSLQTIPPLKGNQASKGEDVASLMTKQEKTTSQEEAAHIRDFQNKAAVSIDQPSTVYQDLVLLEVEGPADTISNPEQQASKEMGSARMAEVNNVALKDPSSFIGNPPLNTTDEKVQPAINPKEDYGANQSKQHWEDPFHENGSVCMTTLAERIARDSVLNSISAAKPRALQDYAPLSDILHTPQQLAAPKPSATQQLHQHAHSSGSSLHCNLPQAKATTTESRMAATMTGCGRTQVVVDSSGSRGSQLMPALGQCRRHTAPEVHAAAGYCPDHFEDVWAARLRREKAQAQAVLAVSSGIIRSSGLLRTLNYSAGGTEEHGKRSTIMHSSLPLSAGMSSVPAMPEDGRIGSNVVLPEEYEQMRRSDGDCALPPRRRGPLARVLAAVGTAVSVTVVTAGAVFAAAALNTGLDEMDDGRVHHKRNYGGGVTRKAQLGHGKNAKQVPKMPYLPSATPSHPDIMLGRG